MLRLRQKPCACKFIIFLYASKLNPLSKLQVLNNHIRYRTLLDKIVNNIVSVNSSYSNKDTKSKKNTSSVIYASLQYMF